MVWEVLHDERRQPLGLLPKNKEITGAEMTLQV